MAFRLPTIYPLTDVSLAGMTHSEQVSKLIEGGATLIQLRDKALSPREFYEQAKPAVALAKSRGVKIIINDRVDLALILGADGVHLGQDDLLPQYARELLGSEAIIGFSTHSVEQVKDALTTQIDYLAIGPVFSTRTKANPDPEVGLEGVRTAKALTGQLPLVAIGGISEDRISEVLKAGADSVALISAIFRDAQQISTTFHRLNSL